MTQNEIIEMAEACGFTRTHTGEVRLWLSNTKDLEAFAKLVAAKEREACAMVCEEEGKLWSKAGCTDTQTFGLCATVIRARGEA